MIFPTIIRREGPTSPVHRFLDGSRDKWFWEPASTPNIHHVLTQSPLQPQAQPLPEDPTSPVRKLLDGSRDKGFWEPASTPIFRHVLTQFSLQQQHQHHSWQWVKSSLSPSTSCAMSALSPAIIVSPCWSSSREREKLGSILVFCIGLFRVLFARIDVKWWRLWSPPGHRRLSHNLMYTDIQKLPKIRCYAAYKVERFSTRPLSRTAHTVDSNRFNYWVIINQSNMVNKVDWNCQLNWKK